jgi:hypothetical protein
MAELARYFYLQNHVEKMERFLNIKPSGKDFFKFFFGITYDIGLVKSNFRHEVLEVLKSQKVTYGAESISVKNILC